MKRLVPEFIEERYATENAKGSFLGSAIFVDISGFTTISDELMEHGQHGVEVLANIIRDVFEPLVQSVFEQGGFVTTLAGDAFTAVFPSDDETSETLLRALAAAWRVQEVMGTSAQHPTPYGTYTLSVKVGLATGEISWGILSSSDGKRAAYYFRGSAIEGSANAEKLAKPGEVIASSIVVEALGPTLETDPVEDCFRVRSINGDLPAPQPVSLRPVESAVHQRFFPAVVVGQDFSGEIRQVASMFISLPTVQTAEQLEIFMQTVFDLQDRYGGFLNRLDFGDKGANLLLIWGAPVAHENDVTRALNFILDMQAQTAVPVNVGITYRTVHVGYSGSDLAGEYTCHGGGTNLASRLMAASPRGEIWVDEYVAEHASRDFEVEFESQMVFKGFAQKQDVFVLLERKQDAELVFEGKLIGREAELARLAELVEPIREGRYAGMLMLQGEPGIGKSRLVHEFVRGFDEGEVSVFVCQTDAIRKESFNPFRYWLRRYFGQSEQQSDARNKRSFNRRFDSLIAVTDDEVLNKELDRTRSFLGALVDLQWPDSLYKQLDARGRYENTFTGLLSLLMAESLQQPVILLLEDAHRLDEDSMAFLVRFEEALTKNPSYPVAIIATARPEGFQEESHALFTHEHIDCGRLASDDIAQLAAYQLGAPASAALRDLLVERAEGNPFFAEQILRYLHEKELLALVEDEWRLTNLQMRTLPADVSAVLVARLDRLSPEVRELVQMASVLGREFDIGLLAHMLLDDPAIEVKVKQAEQEAIWVALGEARYSFKSILLRDAAYHMQVRSRRQTLHALASSALEDLYADNLFAHYGELAYHTELAEQVGKARRYLELAGNQSREAFQNHLAIDYYTRALDLTPDEEYEERYRLLKARESIHALLGSIDQQEQDQAAMSLLAERLNDASKQAEVLILKGWLHYWVAEYSDIHGFVQHAVELATQAADQEIIGKAHYLKAWALLQQGIHDRALEHARKALAGARAAGNDYDTGNVLNALGMITRMEGDYHASKLHLEDFLANSKRIKNMERTATALGNLGVTYTNLGQYAAARDYFEQSLSIRREIGDYNWIGAQMINLAWVAAAEGEWQVAIEQGQAGIEVARKAGRNEVLAEGLIWLGHAWLGLNRPEEAIAAYEESLELRREQGQEHLAMGVVAGLARVAVAQENPELAANYVNEIMSYLDGGGSLYSTWEPLRIVLTCYQVLAMVGDSRAIAVLQTAHNDLMVQASKIPEENLRQTFLEIVPWHREIVKAFAGLSS